MSCETQTRLTRRKARDTRQCTTPHHTAPHRTAPHRTATHRTAIHLHRIVSHLHPHLHAALHHNSLPSSRPLASTTVQYTPLRITDMTCWRQALRAIRASFLRRALELLQDLLLPSRALAAPAVVLAAPGPLREGPRLRDLAGVARTKKQGGASHRQIQQESEEILSCRCLVYVEYSPRRARLLFHCNPVVSLFSCHLRRAVEGSQRRAATRGGVPAAPCGRPLEGALTSDRRGGRRRRRDVNGRRLT